VGDDFCSHVVDVYLPPHGFPHGPIDPTAKDDDIRLIATFSNLERLSLSYNAKIGDDGLAHLRGLRHLRALTLSYTSITDAGLQHLKSLTALQHLSLDDTKTTKAAVDDLAKALPGCKITGRP
jgi:hypothetical protein